MMKNSRPYSVENGYVDDGLITSHSEHEMKTVRNWIADNIIPGSEVLYGRTSYGLKHILEHDTGIYLTNNEFKDAMLFEGYQPEDPDELNWRYRIKLKREINNNPSEFFNWAKRYADSDTPYGDFARDMLSDFDFPKIADRDVITRYLERCGACFGAMAAFEDMWNIYEREAD